MKIPIKITKIKVFNFRGYLYTGFESDGEDYCYIRPDPRSGCYCFTKPQNIEGFISYAGIVMPKLKFGPVYFAKSDFESRYGIIKVLHTNAATLLANGADYVKL